MSGMVVQRVVPSKPKKEISDLWGVAIGPVLSMSEVAILVPEDKAPTWK